MRQSEHFTTISFAGSPPLDTEGLTALKNVEISLLNLYTNLRITVFDGY